MTFAVKEYERLLEHMIPVMHEVIYKCVSEQYRFQRNDKEEKEIGRCQPIHEQEYRTNL